MPLFSNNAWAGNHVIKGTSVVWLTLFFIQTYVVPLK